MKTIHIHKGWFRSAGRMYHWEGDPVGVGIERSILKGNDFIKVVVAGKTYKLDCKQAVDFVRKTKSIYTFRMSKLGVIPKTMLVQISPEKEEIRGLVPDKIVIDEARQPTLF